MLKYDVLRYKELKQELKTLKARAGKYYYVVVARRAGIKNSCENYYLVTPV